MLIGMSDTHTETLDLSIVLPCLDEERTVGACVREALAAMKEAGINGEVIVADNGSTDHSRHVAEKAGGRVVSVPHKGYGSALSGGIAAARSDFVLMADADHSYAFDYLPLFVRKLNEGYDLVMGNRFLGGIGPGAMTVLHRIGNPILSTIGRIFFHTPIRDFHCGMRAFTKHAFHRMRLQTHGMEFASEMVVKATLLGMKITEVPTTLRKDGRDRPPHLKTWRDGWRHLRFMMLFAPRWLLLYPGLGLILLGWTSAAHANLEADPNAIVALFGVACAIIGMEALTFWDVSQAFAFSTGLHPHDPSRRILRSLSRLEPSLILGSMLSVCGIAGFAYATVNNSTADLSIVLLSLAGIVLGVQAILGGILISIIRIQRRSDSI